MFVLPVAQPELIALPTWCSELSDCRRGSNAPGSITSLLRRCELCIAEPRGPEDAPLWDWLARPAYSASSGWNAHPAFVTRGNLQHKQT
jgi:hypothetical protein